MKYTHYYKIDSDVTLLFNIEECENCGGICQAVNSVKGVVSDSPKYNALGLQETSFRPPEQEFNDDLGICTCDNCG